MSMPSSSGASDFGHVLVVDDEADLRDVLAEHLRDLGYRTATAGDGRAAIHAIEREPSAFGLLLVDIELPGTDGFGVLAAARRAGSLAPCVMISGYATLDRAIEAVRLGAYDFLTKPFRLAQLDVILERLQSEQRLTRENHRLHHQNSRLDELRAAVVEGLAHVHARLDRIEQHLGIKRDK